jgi:hypothetical protein
VSGSISCNVKKCLLKNDFQQTHLPEMICKNDDQKLKAGRLEICRIQELIMIMRMRM